MMRSLSLLPKFVATAVIVSSSFVIAQSPSISPSSVLPRIKTQIDDTKLTKLVGNLPISARSQNDRGAADSSTQLTHMRLVLSRSPQQDAALDQYLADLQDKSSPHFHKWLTPEQFGKLYGPADSDIAAITAWLESRGLKIEEVPSGRTNIAFSGTVSQVEQAFHVQIHTFEAGGQQFYSNTGNPSIPSALAPVVSGIAHLDTIRPRPHHIASQPGRMNPKSHRLEPVLDANASKLGPNLTVGSGTSNDPYFLYIVPGDAATIYDTPNTTFNANYTSGTNYTGSGVTIGIGGDATIKAATVTDYRSAFLGNSDSVTISNVDGVTSTSDTDEAYIDTELSGGMAPGAALHYYTSTDLFGAIQQMLSDNSVDIFSLSFGACELDFSTATNAMINSWWKQAAGQGIAVTVSTGDSGSAGCDNTSDSSGNNIAAASYGLAVNGLASTPYNIAVGGTDMDGLLSSFSNYASTSQGSSGTFFRTALKYIPESTWNDSTQADGKISANSPYSGTDANIVGGSGGKSSCSTNSSTNNSNGTCSSGYAKPTWQRGTGVPSDSVRDLPDISLMAGNGYDPATWLICTDDTSTSSGATVTHNCTTQADGYFYVEGFGGTSTSAPAFAGILAIVQQKAGGRLGQAAVELYDLYNGANSSSIFHDVTIGNNSVSCVSGTPNCVKNTAGFYYLSGYDTAAGYDLASGMGSVDVKQLVSFWGTGVGATKPTVKVTPSATSVTNSQSLSVVVAVTGTAVDGTGANATPTGTVTLTSGSYTSSTATLSSGAYTFTIPAGSLASGADTITASYSGDVNFASATGTASVTATTATVSVSPATLTFASTLVGSSAATQAVTLKNTGTGTVTITKIAISGTNASSFGETNTCGSSIATTASCAITVTFTPQSAGTLTATISITDNTGTTQTIALTGTGATPVAAVTLSSSALTFPSTLVGSSAATQSVTVKNSGTASLTISKIAITGTNASSFSETTTCGATLAVSATCTITAKFTPTTAGTLTASIGITDNASAASTITLTGTATSPAPVVSLSSSSLTFGSTLVGSSAATQAVTVKNTGSASLSISKIAITGTNASSFSETTTCGSSLAASATCTITTTFTPTAAGTLTASIAITDNASAASSITLTGTGVTPAPVASLSPASLTFASTAVGASATTQAVTLKNTGTAALTLTSVSVSGANASSFKQTNTCGSGLAIGASCTITVTFTPASVGSLTASLALAGNVTGSVTLTGTGSEPSGATFTLAAAAVTITPGSTGTSAITATGTGGYTGASTITLSACTLTTSPTGATDSPTCSITSSTVTLAAGSTTGSGGSVTIGTTAAANAIKKAQLKQAQLKQDQLAQRNSIRRWTGVGGLAIAGILFFGIPARNRKWRSLLGAFAFLAILGFASGCSSGGPKDKGTTAGSYTFTVTGTDASGTTANATITVTVS